MSFTQVYRGRERRRRGVLSAGETWWRLWIGVSLLMSLQHVRADEVTLELQSRSFQRVDALYEPSGIVQLSDGRLLVVEDEPTHAFVLLSPLQNAATFAVEVLETYSPLAALVGKPRGMFIDLEGLVLGPENSIYAITSHSRQANGKRNSAREKLVRLQIEKNRITQFSVRTDMRKSLVDAFPGLQDAADEKDVKDDAGLNIEGLTFNRQNDALWIGFRSPLLDDKAIVLGVRNPQALFDSGVDFQFEDQLQLLDLDGGGIRDIAFDAHLDGYLIVSQREGTKHEKSFKLWFWEGSSQLSPRRVRISGITDLLRTEGLSSVTLAGKQMLLLVSDDGDAGKRQPAHVLLVDYDELEIE